MELDIQFWTLVVAGIGAIASIIFTIVELYVRVYSPRTETKRLREMEAMESLKNEYSRCVSSIKSSIEKHVEKNEKASLEASLQDSWVVGDMKVPEELRKQVQEFNEKCKDYNLFLRISERFIIEAIEKKIKRMFHKTLKKYEEFPAILCADFLMERYSNGEKVTANWLREEHPIPLKNITKDIDETEMHELDIFFNEVNKDFKKEEILQRFRKEKSKLMRHGEETVKTLQKEVDSLNKKLEKYGNLCVVEDYDEE